MTKSSSPKKVLLIFGTRPEAIKLAPLYEALKNDAAFDVKICSTGQHRELLLPILRFFAINPDHSLKIMQPNQSLSQLTARAVQALDQVLDLERPDLVVVQGDTTSAFAGSLAAFYKQIPVAHVEAGLRSDNRYSPFPEEINRTLIGRLASSHFTPTKLSSINLEKEGVFKNVFQTGNTVIDALFSALLKMKSSGEEQYFKHFSQIDFNKKILLITAHRRESFGMGFKNICSAVKEIATSRKDVEIAFVTHFNPNVRKPVFEILSSQSNIHLLEPLEYDQLLWILNKSYLVLTDSGGIQEEAPSLGKPVLVMRDVTERGEGIEAGVAKLVGTDQHKIIEAVTHLLDKPALYENMAKATNPYGDGRACERILSHFRQLFGIPPQ